MVNIQINAGATPEPQIHRGLPAIQPTWNVIAGLANSSLFRQAKLHASKFPFIGKGWRVSTAFSPNAEEKADALTLSQ
ncbi:hypothetical protein SBBP2_1390009 [Burkholderiales bacterium]|nr:hypothetical protein SBBP2_1390009 [Burkholderiales bacterium]